MKITLHSSQKITKSNQCTILYHDVTNKIAVPSIKFNLKTKKLKKKKLFSSPKISI